VLFVSHRARRVTLVERVGSTWDEREFRPGEVVTVRTPRLEFPVDALYDGITLDPL